MAHLFYHSISTSSIAQKLILFIGSPTSLGRYDADAILLKRDSEDEQERCTRIDAYRNNFWADYHESPIDLVQWHGVHWASAGQTRWTHHNNSSGLVTMWNKKWAGPLPSSTRGLKAAMRQIDSEIKLREFARGQKRRRTWVWWVSMEPSLKRTLPVTESLTCKSFQEIWKKWVLHIREFHKNKILCFHSGVGVILSIDKANISRIAMV